MRSSLNVTDLTPNSKAHVKRVVGFMDNAETAQCTVAELDAELALLLLDTPLPPPSPHVAGSVMQAILPATSSSNADPRGAEIDALHARMARLEKIFDSTMDAFEVLAEKRIAAAATDAANSMRRLLTGPSQ